MKNRDFEIVYNAENEQAEPPPPPPNTPVTKSE